MTIVGRGDGSESWQFTYAPEPIRVFEGEDVFGLIGVACAALFDGDPSTNPPEPIATGVGWLTYNDVLDAHGTLRVHNSLVGKVTPTDGDVVQINTFAKYTVENDVLELQQLRVNYGG